jgi:hypothetical protein
VLLLVLLQFLLFTDFSKAEYFKIISGEDVVVINKMIEKIEQSDESLDKMAYLGALKMRKSVFLKSPKEKLILFKNGKHILETAIVKNTENLEYRFLRLLLQENAPAFLKYNMNIREDANMLLLNSEKLPNEVKKAFLNYTKISPSLKR